MNIINCENISFDKDQAVRDLSLAFAKAKLDEAMQQSTFHTSDASDEVHQMEYLAEIYYSAIGHFSSHTTEYIKLLVDHK